MTLQVRRSFVGFLMMIALTLPAQAQETLPDGDFNRGVEFYEQGRYHDALKWFEEIHEKGRVSSNLYYNIGNCHFRLGRRAEAVRAYLRVLKLDPRDEDVRWNLGLIRKQLADKKERADGYLGLGWLYGLVRYVRTDELAIAFSGGVLALSLILLGYTTLISLRPFWRKILFAAVIYTVLAGSLVALRYYEAKDPAGVVRNKELFVRYGPSREATKAFLLHEGTEVVITNESQEWYSIRFGVRQRGWVPKKSLLRV